MAMVYLQIAPINDAPQLVAQPEALSIAEDSPAQMIVLSGVDVETPADQLTITIAALPAHGSLTRSDGSLVTSSDQLPSPVELRYTPAADAYGDDTLRAVVSDGGEVPSVPLSTELIVPITITQPIRSSAVTIARVRRVRSTPAAIRIRSARK